MTLARIGFWTGLALFVLMLASGVPAGLSDKGWITASLTVLIACWWFTEAVPVTMTGCLPFLVLPLFGVVKADAVAANYMSPVLFLVLGGSMVGLAFEKWNLHRRTALFVVRRSSPEPAMLLLSIMAVTALVSAFVNNSATTVMMLPIAAATLAAVTRTLESPNPDHNEANFASAMVVSVAFASNIGGFATPIGTPVNPIAIGLIEKNLGVRVTFVEWLGFGLPFVLLAIPLCWWILSRVTMPFTLPRADRESVQRAIGESGPMTTPEKRVLAVVLGASAAWVFQPVLEARVPGVTDAGIAIAAALVMFILPSGARSDQPARLLEWSDARRAPFYLILLLGGGLALADAVVKTGLSAWLGAQMGAVAGLPLLPLLVVISLCCALVTEVASNVATATIFMPIAVSLATAGGYDAVGPAMVAGLAASLGFANPAATSSNALVFGTGRVRMADMLRAGLLFDVLGAGLLAVVCYLVLGAR